jgi:hypothetical protein
MVTFLIFTERLLHKDINENIPLYFAEENNNMNTAILLTNAIEIYDVFNKKIIISIFFS